jgi:hypothetical protein
MARRGTPYLMIVALALAAGLGPGLAGYLAAQWRRMRGKWLRDAAPADGGSKEPRIEGGPTDEYYRQK